MILVLSGSDLPIPKHPVSAALCQTSCRLIVNRFVAVVTLEKRSIQNEAGKFPYQRKLVLFLTLVSFSSLVPYVKQARGASFMVEDIVQSLKIS